MRLRNTGLVRPPSGWTPSASKVCPRFVKANWPKLSAGRACAEPPLYHLFNRWEAPVGLFWDMGSLRPADENISRLVASLKCVATGHGTPDSLQAFASAQASSSNRSWHDELTSAGFAVQPSEPATSDASPVLSDAAEAWLDATPGPLTLILCTDDRQHLPLIASARKRGAVVSLVSSSPEVHAPDVKQLSKEAVAEFLTHGAATPDEWIRWESVALHSCEEFAAARHERAEAAKRKPVNYYTAVGKSAKGKRLALFESRRPRAKTGGPYDKAIASPGLSYKDAEVSLAKALPAASPVNTWGVEAMAKKLRTTGEHGGVSKRPTKSMTSAQLLRLLLVRPHGAAGSPCALRPLQTQVAYKKRIKGRLHAKVIPRHDPFSRSLNPIPAKRN